MSETVQSSLKKTVKGTSLVFAGAVVGFVVSFAAKVLVVRNTTAEVFGLYSLALAVFSVCAIFANLGLQQGITRFVSVFLGEGRKEDADSVARSSVRLSFFSGAAFSIALIALSEVAAQKVFYKPEIVLSLRIAALGLPFTVLARTIAGALRGYNLIGPKVYYIDIGQPLFFLLFFLAALIPGITLENLMYCYLFSMAMMFLAVGCYGYKKTGLSPLALRGGRHGGELLRFSLPLIVSGLMAVVFSWTDTLILGRYVGAGEVGIYNVAAALGRVLVFPLLGVGFVFMPIAGEMYARKQFAELKRTYQVLTKWSFALTLPVFFVLFLFPETTIKFLFGARFVDAADPLRLLSLGFIFNAFFGSNGMLMVVLGLSKTIMNVSVIAAVVNITLNYILVKRLGLGMTGAAISTMVSYIFMNVVFSSILYLREGIHPVTAKYIKPVLGSSVIGLLLYAAAKLLIFEFWMLPVYFALFIAGYVLVLLFSKSLDHEDLFMFEAISKKTGLEMNFIRKILQRFGGD